MAAGSKFSPGDQRGFTLLETLVVLTLLAIMMAVVVPAVGRSLAVSLDDAVRDLQVTLRQARSEALNRQRSVSVMVDLDERSYRSASGRVRRLPDDFELHARVATREVRGRQAGIRFYPDGSSTGGRFGLAEGDTLIWLEVDWLTGRVARVADEF